MINRTNKTNIFSIVRYSLSKKLIIALFSMLAVFLVAYFNTKITFYSSGNAIDKMSIQVEKSKYSSIPYGLLWFDFNNEIISLNVNILCDNSQMKMFALTKEGKIVPVSVAKSDILLKDTFSGSFVTVLPPFQADINNDGTKENIQLSAKADTIFTQGFAPVKTDFSDEQILMEIYNLRNGRIKILYDQKPLVNKEVLLISNRGLNKNLKTDSLGTLQIKDVRDLRAGIQVVYVENNNTYNISSYTVESNKLFTKYHYKALTPLLRVLLISAIIILLIATLRGFLPSDVEKKQKYSDRQVK